MANSRITRFIMEVAPPQYVTVMRHRTSKMSLDTITEEDQREINDHYHSQNPSSSSSSSSLFPSKASLSSSATATSSTSISSVSIPSADSKYFLKEVHRSLSNLNH